MVRVCTSDCWYVPLSHAVHGADPVTEKKPPVGHGEIRLGYRVQNERACYAVGYAARHEREVVEGRELEEKGRREREELMIPRHVQLSRFLPSPYSVYEPRGHPVGSPLPSGQ